MSTMPTMPTMHTMPTLPSMPSMPTTPTMQYASYALALCTMPAMQHCRGWVGCIVPVIDPVRFPTCVSGFVKYLYLDLSSYLELRVGNFESDINQCCYSHFWKYHYFLFFDCMWSCSTGSGCYKLQIMLQKQFIFPWLKCVLYCLFRSATIKATKYYDSLTQKKKI